MKSIKAVILLSFLISISNCMSQSGNNITGEYMNMKSTKIPILLSPELISSSLDEYNGTFSPDGKEFFFTTNTPEKGIICKTKLNTNGEWTKAAIAKFSGEFSEYDPLFSPNGDKLYFTSERPLNKKDSSGKTNIWYVEKQNSNWSEPKYLDLGMQGVYYSSITQKGDIYFNNWDTGDMYRAVKTKNNYKPKKLTDILNSKSAEGDPFISPREDYIIFRGHNNSFGLGDLYISYKIGTEWTKPENLGEPINSKANEMCPYVTLDEKFFIFSSNRVSNEYPSQASRNLEEIRKKHQTSDNGELNIYYISADFINEKKKKYE